MTELVIDLTPKEIDALQRIADTQQMTMGAVLRQSLRLYELSHIRTMAGETVTWSGDKQRLRDFVGELYKDPVPTIYETYEAKMTYVAGMEANYPGVDPRMSLLGMDDDRPYEYKTDAYGWSLVPTPTPREILMRKVLIGFGVYFIVSRVVMLAGLI